MISSAGFQRLLSTSASFECEDFSIPQVMQTETVMPVNLTIVEEGLGFHHVVLISACMIQQLECCKSISIMQRSVAKCSSSQ